jgi:hypothetical protein
LDIHFFKTSDGVSLSKVITIFGTKWSFPLALGHFGSEASFLLGDYGFFVGDGVALGTGSETMARLNDGGGLGYGDSRILAEVGMFWDGDGAFSYDDGGLGWCSLGSKVAYLSIAFGASWDGGDAGCCTPPSASSRNGIDGIRSFNLMCHRGHKMNLLTASEFLDTLMELAGEQWSCICCIFLLQHIFLQVGSCFDSIYSLILAW